jgi:hypothetical protein
MHSPWLRGILPSRLKRESNILSVIRKPLKVISHLQIRHSIDFR